MAARVAPRRIGLFEDFKTKNFTVEDVVRCIDAGGVIYATVVRGMPGNDPDQPMSPVSVDDAGLVTVWVDGAYHEVELANIDRIEWSGGLPGRVDEALRVSPDLADVIEELYGNGNKVAAILRKVQTGKLYDDDEDVNFIDLAEDINKFSFTPMKRRSENHYREFDRKSMPTRIGRLTRKILNKLEPMLTYEAKGNFEILPYNDGHNVQMPSGPDREVYMVFTGDSEGSFIHDMGGDFGPVGMALSVDGQQVGAKFLFITNTISGHWLEKTIVFESDKGLVAPHRTGAAHEVSVRLTSNLGFTDSDLAAFVNGAVAFIKVNRVGEVYTIEEVSGEAVRHWYHRDNYQSHRGELGSSCMSYDRCQEYLDLYCKNPRQVSLLILKSAEGRLIGRALLWNLDNGERFMDRVYSVLDSDREVFHRHARENGWVYRSSPGEILKGKASYSEDLLSVTLETTDFGLYPYLDTLRYLGEDGRLSTFFSPGDKLLNRTDGGHAYDDDYDYSDDRFDESLKFSTDLENLLYELQKSGDKIAKLLVWLNGSDVYPDKEDINFLELSSEINKFSFIPKNRRSDDPARQYDRDSMPTRIGKIVRKIFKTVKDTLTYRHKGRLRVKALDDLQVRDSLGRLVEIEDGWTKYEFTVGKTIPFLPMGGVEMTLAIDGEDVQAKFSELAFEHHWFNQSWKRVETILFSSPETIVPGKVNVSLELKSDFAISDKEIEDFVNGVVAYLKANRFGDETVIEQVKGEHIRFWYNGQNYQSTQGELGNSCMAYQDCQDFLDIYCENPDKVSLVILRSKENKLIGRALLWNLDSGERFMDRAYSIVNSDSVVLRDLARKNGWLYKQGKHTIMKGNSEINKAISVTLENHEFEYYPYMDTLKYLSWDGVLSDVGDSDDKYLNSTDGGYVYDEDED